MSSAFSPGISTPEKAILRNYINATIGFEELSRRTKRPAKSLMRMLGPSGNPQARNLFGVIWQIADLLRRPYRPPQDERVMLPMTELRSAGPRRR